MTDSTAAPPPRRSARIWLWVLLLMVTGAGLGFGASYRGPWTAWFAGSAHEDLGISFVPLPVIVVSLEGVQGARHLRLSSQLEVEPAQAGRITALTPRLLDMVNGYLRAVDPRDLQAAGAMQKVRMQLLHRLQTLVGPGVKDLLITEFLIT